MLGSPRNNDPEPPDLPRELTIFFAASLAPHLDGDILDQEKVPSAGVSVAVASNLSIKVR